MVPALSDEKTNGVWKRFQQSVRSVQMEEAMRNNVAILSEEQVRRAVAPFEATAPYHCGLVLAVKVACLLGNLPLVVSEARKQSVNTCSQSSCFISGKVGPRPCKLMEFAHYEGLFGSVCANRWFWFKAGPRVKFALMSGRPVVAIIGYGLCLHYIVLLGFTNSGFYFTDSSELKYISEGELREIWDQGYLSVLHAGYTALYIK
jgi:hypothetical protein